MAARQQVRDSGSGAREGATAASGSYLPAAREGRPPLRRTPKGLTYAQGRPHPPAAPAADDQTQELPAAQDQAPAAEPVTVASGGGVAQETGGAMLALFLWPLIFNLVKGGPGQMWGWVKAKFINQPYSASGAGAKPAPTGSQGSGTTQAQAKGRPGPGVQG